MSEHVERLSRRALLGRVGVTASVLALGGTAGAGVAGADVEHGLGGVGLADGTIETGEVFTLRGPGESVELDNACLADGATGVPLQRYAIDYCAVDAAASLYVQPGVVQPASNDVYAIESSTPCSGTDRAVVVLRPVQNPRACLPGGW